MNFNGWEDTVKCLHSVQLIRHKADTVLIDNASTEDRCTQIRQQFPWCHVVREPVNGGWAGGNNAGLRYALNRGAEQIILLNNDTTVSPSLIHELQQASVSHPEYGIIGPVINHMSEPDEVMTDGCLFNRPGSAGFFQRLEVPVCPGEPQSITEVDIVNGCCLMVSRAVCEKIGLVDESFFLIHEESDFCLRARDAGFKCGVINRSLVLHKGSTSFKRTGQRTQRYYDARNLRLLLRKHVGNHQEGRGTWASFGTYANYVFYRYAAEVENKSHEAAQAVIDGTYDGLRGYFGPYQQDRRRIGRGLLQLLFSARFQLSRFFKRTPQQPVAEVPSVN